MMEKLISWVEIPTADFDRAVKFYNNVLKIELKVETCDTEKMACFPTGEGAIIYADGYKPSSNGVIVSLQVPDTIDATMARIKENGGELVVPKTKIQVEGLDYFALFLDSEGNKIGLYGK